MVLRSQLKKKLPKEVAAGIRWLRDAQNVMFVILVFLTLRCFILESRLTRLTASSERIYNKVASLAESWPQDERTQLYLDILARDYMDDEYLATVTWKGHYLGWKSKWLGKGAHPNAIVSLAPLMGVREGKGGQLIRTEENLARLDLTHENIGNAGAGALEEALRYQTGLKVLILSHNEIGPAGASALAGALASSSIEEFWNTGNPIGSAGVVEIAHAIEISQTLRMIDLGSNQMGAGGARHLGSALAVNQVITHVGLADNMIGDDGIMAIEEALKMNKSIKVLDLQGNQIEKIGAGGLADALKTNAVLEKLDISLNNIGDIGATALMNALKMNSALKKLDIGSNHLTDSSTTAVAEMLRVNKALETLAMYDNTLTMVGGGRISEGLEQNEAIKVLNLRQTKIPAAIKKVLKQQAESKRFTIYFDHM